MILIFLVLLVFCADLPARAQTRFEAMVRKRSEFSPDSRAVIERNSNFSPEASQALTRRSEFDTALQGAISRRSEFDPGAVGRLERRSSFSPQTLSQLQRRSGFSPESVRRIQTSSEAPKGWLEAGRTADSEFDRMVSRLSQMAGDEVARLSRGSESGPLSQRVRRQSLWEASVDFVQKHSTHSKEERRMIDRRSGD